ncbi:uncharacterized protein AtWU_07601 [Aspergillus tubingensis]|uniref:uncharacterized protein n=1 Tax=Aspergillus tubingensis TaxID=5068 RepID=UPI001577A7D5|nr:uncharacterized protein AtWU_07601 [Aspergillus tubingensis]GFN17799.1 hypothetical protein AtWU_07601 [Aspergillus tubingensis]
MKLAAPRRRGCEPVCGDLDTAGRNRTWGLDRVALTAGDRDNILNPSTARDANIRSLYLKEIVLPLESFCQENSRQAACPSEIPQLLLAVQHLPCFTDRLAQEVQLAVDEARVERVTGPGAYIDNVETLIDQVFD